MWVISLPVHRVVQATSVLQQLVTLKLLVQLEHSALARNLHVLRALLVSDVQVRLRT